MSGLYEEKRLSPMLIGASEAPFDSEDYLFELKFDGVRCLAYVDRGSVQLRNKRNLNVTATYPELSGLNKQVQERCILDGELVVFRDGKPNFFEIQRRSIMGDTFRIQLAADRLPVFFVAFDILYIGEKDVMLQPLEERKQIMETAVREGGQLMISRVINAAGTQLFDLAEKEGLEGVVAKRKGSLYFCGKRTRDWIKIKNLQDDDYVVLGFIRKNEGMNSLILGQYRDGQLAYKGHVTLGVGGELFRRIQSVKKAEAAPVVAPPGNENAVWLEPKLVCTVKFMERTPSGGMRQPTFKGIREDKLPEECLEPSL